MLRLTVVGLCLWAFGCGKDGTTDSATNGARTQLKSTDVFRDGDLHISVSAVAPSGVVANTTVLGLVIENRSPGKIYHLPLWDERQQAARITDEYGNVFRPQFGQRYYRNPLVPSSPTANGNRVDPGANDALALEFELIPPSSKRLAVELPYNGGTLVFKDIAHSPR